MSNNDNKLKIIKDDLFILISSLGKGIEDKMIHNKIDSQAIFAYTKLIESLLKIEVIVKEDNMNQYEEISEEDKLIVSLFEKCIEDVAPRAGFEPATKRLTAACSTTELPRNDNKQ